MHRLALFLLLGCVQNEQAKAWYDDVESGSHWRLDLGDGKLDDYSPRDGTCPALATKYAHLPDGAATGCEPGCTCGLSASLDNDGDGPSTDWTAMLFFDQTCPDHASLSCFDVHPEYGEPIRCRWTKDLVSCNYTLTPHRAD